MSESHSQEESTSSTESTTSGREAFIDLLTDQYIEAQERTLELAADLRFNNTQAVLNWNLFQLKLRTDVLIEHLMPAVVDDEQSPMRLAYELSFHLQLHGAIQTLVEQQRGPKLIVPE